MDQETVSAVMSQMGKKGGKVGGRARMESLTPEQRSALARKAAAKSAEVRSAKAAARDRLVVPISRRAPETSSASSELASCNTIPVEKGTATRQQLTRKQGLNVAADVIHSLRGYRKNPGYRTMQNDLNFLCEVLQRASAGETKNIGKPMESD